MTAERESRATATIAMQKRYPRDVTLRDDRGVSLQLMSIRDYVPFTRFAKALPRRDLLFEEQDITDSTVLDEWMRSIRRGHAATVLAYAGEAIVGEASLTHSRTEWMRHTGEVRIIVASDARGTGLGHVLADEIFACAGILGLERLTAQMLEEQRQAKVVFERLGFEQVATLPRAAVDLDGKKHDIIVMMRDL